MRNLLFFVGFALAEIVGAQQMIVDPTTTSENLVISSLEEVGFDNFVGVGWVYEAEPRAMVSRISGGSLDWSKVLGAPSEFRSSSIIPSSSSIVAVGKWDENPLICRINQAGTLEWSTLLVTYPILGIFTDVTVDQFGGPVAVGHKGVNFSSLSQIITRFNAIGDVVWSKEVPRQSTGSDYAEKVFVIDNKVFVFGTCYLASGEVEICLLVLDLFSGNLLDYRTYGHFGPEAFYDAVPYGDGFVFSYRPFGGGDVHVARVDGSLNLVGNPAGLISSVFGNDVTGGALSTNGTDIFLSGRISGAGGVGSFGAKLNSNLDVVWARKIVSGDAFGEYSISRPGGSVMFVDVLNGTPLGSITGAVMAQFSGNGNQYGEYCLNSEVLNLESLGGVLQQGTQTKVLMDFVPSVDQFRVWDDYSPRFIDCSDSELPIELFSFVVESRTASVDLSWQTASELNNDHFKILRSTNMDTWETIGHVDGSGTTYNTTSYSFIDTSPHEGVNYYKLRQVDVDGGWEESFVVVASFESKDLLIYPNPTSAGSSVTLGSDEDVLVYSQDGRRVPFEKSGNRLVVLAPPGVYHIVAIDPLGQKKATLVITN